MGTFFYSYDDSKFLEANQHSSAGKPDDALTFNALMERVGAGDTLVVGGLADLGHKAGEISETVKRLQDRQVRVVVLQLGEADLTAPENRTACRLLDAMADLECRRPRQRKEARTARARDRSDWETIRATVVTQYSLGESIASLARRYNVPRSRIEKIVCPKQPAEPPLPAGFGD